MLSTIFFCNLLVIVFSENIHRIVSLDEGVVKGEKYWNGDYYEFYGIPYASVPKGKDKFKDPLPPLPWNGILDAKNKHIVCPQPVYSGDNDVTVVGETECLVLNIFFPLEANENNLLPVIMYVHSGAFAAGHGNMGRFHYLVRHDVIVISINYRLGVTGFLCLGNEDIPGNTGLKDQVAALKWINKNVRKFGGDPSKVTVAGFSVGAAMVELLSISPLTEGLIDKIILESGSGLSSWAINRDPVRTALNYAIGIGFNKTNSVKDLTKFYLNTPEDILASRSLNMFLPNGTFGFAPCIEKKSSKKTEFLSEDPLHVIKNKNYNEVAILTGYSNMEGLSRVNHFNFWLDDMNESFDLFLPTDLNFPRLEDKFDTINRIKEKYFNDGDEITHDNLQDYVDYMSDALYKYSMIKSVKAHAANSRKRKIYLYEFSYVGHLSFKHNYMDKIKGASHRDQSSYIIDFYASTNTYSDLDVRERLTTMWTDFAKYEDPTSFESVLIDFKWHQYTNSERNYLHINTTVTSTYGLFEDDYLF